MATIEKPNLNCCFIGHVDSGKSTTVGNLAYQLGFVDERKMEKLRKEAELKGRDSFSYAYVTDINAAERDRGITITTTLIKLETGKFKLNVIDCPGHKDFIKNMVTGAAQADVGCVIVPSAGNEFESAISGGTLRDHIMVSGVLGVKKLICCVNKLDGVPAAEQENRFKEVAEEMKRIITRTHPDKNPCIIPISGFKGINIVEKGEKFSWFKGWKPDPKDDSVAIFTLEGALDWQTVPVRPLSDPLRMPIVGVHKIPGIGSVYTGRVDCGTIKPNMPITIEPTGIVAEIKSLEIHKVAQTQVVAGENCGLALKAVSKGDPNLIKAGCVVSDAKNNPIKVYEGCRAKIVIIDHPKGVKVGYCPIMDLGTHHVPVKIVKFIEKRMPSVKEAIPVPEMVCKGENAICILIPQKPTVMEEIKSCPSLARFALRDGGRIVAIGAIESRYTAEELKKECGDDVLEKAGLVSKNPIADKKGDKKKKK
ncbi:Elongation factor 1-alpha [Astathelohania contejeani]|uniref:Elongation factor 1-alpha n=1 Tax=Astathelohania contejeani TaxID=164912 RepID=A0ABQ7I2G7_9MICR|nr:Elongation factor 1-alpha [Thelohania contejeani]